MKKNKEKNKIVLIPINQGFVVRYFLQTDIFKKLQENNYTIILLVPNPQDPFFESYKKYKNIIIEKYEIQKCSEYLKFHKIERWISQTKRFILNGKYNIQTVKDIYTAFLKDNKYNFSKGRKQIKKLAMIFFIIIARHLKMIRKIVLFFEQLFYSPPLHQKIFNQYNPDLLIVSSLGTFDYDQFLMREAKKYNVKVTTIVLSWDNTTTRGMAGTTPDYIVAWTENMKRELIELNDLPSRKIFVGGVEHFDHYYNNSTFVSRAELCKTLGLDLNKKILFFATKSPNGYAWNADIAKYILEAISKNEIVESCQLLVRLHPIYYRRQNGNYVFQPFLDQFEKLKKQFSGLIINKPEMSSKYFNYSMPSNEIKLLASILKCSDVVINMFSTLNLEACIFDIPIVNVCFEGESYSGPSKARYNIAMDEAQTHNQRIVQSGAIKIVRNKTQLIDGINAALFSPHIGREGRKFIKETECGPFPGQAGKHIAQYIENILH